jgi:hypothetical protein
MSHPFRPLSIMELKRDFRIIRESNSTGDEIKTETDHTLHTLPERNIPTTGNNPARLRNLLNSRIQQ